MYHAIPSEFLGGNDTKGNKTSKLAQQPSRRSRRRATPPPPATPPVPSGRGRSPSSRRSRSQQQQQQGATATSTVGAGAGAGVGGTGGTKAKARALSPLQPVGGTRPLSSSSSGSMASQASSEKRRHRSVPPMSGRSDSILVQLVTREPIDYRVQRCSCCSPYVMRFLFCVLCAVRCAARGARHHHWQERCDEGGADL